jgi:hypothetical protein
MRSKKLSTTSSAALAIFIVILLMTDPRTAAHEEKVLHNFNVSGIDGNLPRGGLSFDSSGSL